MATKWQPGASGEGGIFRILTTNAAVSVVILFYRFARCYHWGKLNKRHFLQNFECIYSYLKT